MPPPLPAQIPLEDLDYQRQAIAAVVDVLEGQIKNSLENSNLFGIQANISDLTPEQIDANKRRIIAENRISEEDAKLSPDPDICVEMETGTGKTLVYLRTIYELYRRYRLTKFILFVPSIAVREGFLSTFATFKATLADRYGFTPACFPYDSGKLTRLRHFIEDTQPQIMAMTIQSINRERLLALKQLFPDLFTNEGRLNVDELKKVVDPALVSETERYDFRWCGKSASKRAAFTPSRAALVREPEGRSVNPEKAGGNMIIEGENLEVLKLLSSAYRERIKCIYIDPPYNTGKDFVYSDRFAEGQKPYWEQTGVLQEGVKVDTNTESDGRFHSNWLSMMHSRLLVARYLLREDGVIFVSIDDNEVQNLRRVMDEVFGEENFVATVIWQKKYSTKADSKHLSESHDYIVVYARNRLYWT